MRRNQRLRANDDFQRVRRSGRSWAHPLLALCALYRAPDRPARIGVTVSRRVGGAVVRNRVRRRVREAARTRYDRLAMGWDLVFVARSGAASASGAEIGQAVESLLNRAGLLGV